MGKRALQNRVKRLKELEAQQKTLEQEMETLKAEIKSAMEEKGAEELQAGNFLIRWKAVVSKRFDTKVFATEHKSLYAQYLKDTETRRFTVV